jgi:hypothetical protein
MNELIIECEESPAWAADYIIKLEAALLDIIGGGSPDFEEIDTRFTEILAESY